MVESRIMCFCNEKSATRHAVISAYLSIVAGIWELSLSIWAGHNEKSMSVYGIGIMAFVDIAGSILVLSLWQFGTVEGMRLLSERRREMHYSVCIGAMMIFLGMFLIADSLQRFLNKSTMTQSSLGLVDGITGTVFGVGLAMYKYYVGKSLDSPVVLADSVSSFCGGMASCLSLLVFVIDDEVWWSDSTAGFTAAFYTFYSGVTTLVSANVSCTSLYLTQALLNFFSLFSPIHICGQAELSKLNRLQRGGPRLAPDYVRRLAKNSSNADLMNPPEAVHATSLDGPYDEFSLDVGRKRQGRTIDWFYQLFVIPKKTAHSEVPVGASMEKRQQESQRLLPVLPLATDSEDRHEPPNAFLV